MGIIVHSFRSCQFATLTVYLYIVAFWARHFPRQKPQKHKLRLHRTAAVAVPDLFSLHILMAAEDEGRTEEPSDRKIQREREKGRVAKSAEIPGTLVTIGILLILFVLAGWFLSGLANIMKLYLGGFSSMPSLHDGGLMKLMVSITKEMGWLLMPVFVVAVVLGIAGNVIQFGFLFSLKPIAFEFSNISLTWDKLMKRVFFSRQVIMNLLKSMAKFIFLGVIAYFLIYNDIGTLLKTTSMSIAETLKLVSYLSFKLALILSVLLLLIAIPDYFYQRFEYMESLKMTVQEVKEEYKESEGDPLIKGEMRRRMQERRGRELAGNVAEASVVITNPTHYAVALAYEPGKNNAPVILAKGTDSIALYIRRIAMANNVPIVEDRPLARGLYAAGQEGMEIPLEFFSLVAKVLIPIINRQKQKVSNAS